MWISCISKTTYVHTVIHAMHIILVELHIMYLNTVTILNIHYTELAD